MQVQHAYTATPFYFALFLVAWIAYSIQLYINKDLRFYKKFNYRICWSYASMYIIYCSFLCDICATTVGSDIYTDIVLNIFIKKRKFWEIPSLVIIRHIFAHFSDLLHYGFLQLSQSQRRVLIVSCIHWIRY